MDETSYSREPIWFYEGSFYNGHQVILDVAKGETNKNKSTRGAYAFVAYDINNVLNWTSF